MIRLVNLGHCLLYRRKGLPFIILKPVQREPERRDNGRRIVSLSNGVKTAMTGTIMPLSEKVVYPFLSTWQKLRAFILSTKDLNAQEFSFLGDESLRRFLFRSMILFKKDISCEINKIQIN